MSLLTLLAVAALLTSIVAIPLSMLMLLCSLQAVYVSRRSYARLSDMMHHFDETLAYNVDSEWSDELAMASTSSDAIQLHFTEDGLAALMADLDTSLMHNSASDCCARQRLQDLLAYSDNSSDDSSESEGDDRPHQPPTFTPNPLENTLQAPCLLQDPDNVCSLVSPACCELSAPNIQPCDRYIATDAGIDRPDPSHAV